MVDAENDLKFPGNLNRICFQIIFSIFLLFFIFSNVNPTVGRKQCRPSKAELAIRDNWEQQIQAEQQSLAIGSLEDESVERNPRNFSELTLNCL